MTLVLDARQRAMLEEMGIKVWMPQPATAANTAAEPVMAPTRAKAAPTPARQPEPTPTAQSSAPAIAAAPALAQPVRGHSRPPADVRADTSAAGTDTASAPTLCITAPERLYPAEGQPATGGWLVVVDMPPGAEGRDEGLLDGEAGRLLDQMLRALRLHAGTAPVHALRLWRATPGQPHAGGVLDFDGAFAEAVAPLAPHLVLALGPLAAQRLLDRQAPLGRLRGSVHRAVLAGADCAVVASYPPAYLLRNGADKARAWADLCLAAECIEGAT